ncbi:MAG: hypothetical protein FJX74_23340 [Armatimonadetes bacterium]|nr:hypothetical protein [Armatimonadota bacterium]
MKRFLLCVVFLVVVVAVGAVIWRSAQRARDDQAFRQASAEEMNCGDDLERALAAYRGYLARFPAGMHAEAARAKVERDLPARIEARDETRAWETAETKDSKEGYKAYLAAYPSGPHAAAAREGLGRLAQAAAREAALQASATARVKAAAARGFARGRPVYLWLASSGAAKKDEDITICYMVDPSAKARPCTLVADKVDEKGRREGAFRIGAPSPDHSRSLGRWLTGAVCEP